MEVLHLTPSINGYEIVELIANRVDRNNHLAVIQKNGELHMTGGLLLPNDEQIKSFLSQIAPEDQYNFVWKMKNTPFVKSYLDE